MIDRDYLLKGLEELAMKVEMGVVEPAEAIRDIAQGVAEGEFDAEPSRGRRSPGPTTTGVRLNDHETSRHAASLVDATTHEGYVWRLMLAAGEDGLADQELLSRYPSVYPGTFAESTPRKRRQELTEKGLVEDSGTTKVINGSEVIVWRRRAAAARAF